MSDERDFKRLEHRVTSLERKLDELIRLLTRSNDSALALSGSVSRRDMATACGLNKSRVDQIIVIHTQRLQDQRNAVLRERVRRHMPPGTSLV